MPELRREKQRVGLHSAIFRKSVLQPNGFGRAGPPKPPPSAKVRLSPLSETYRAEIESIAETMNRLTPDMIEAHSFETLAEGIERLERMAAGI